MGGQRQPKARVAKAAKAAAVKIRTTGQQIRIQTLAYWTMYDEECIHFKRLI
jgi:hypothetical protein